MSEKLNNNVYAIFESARILTGDSIIFANDTLRERFSNSMNATTNENVNRMNKAADKTSVELLPQPIPHTEEDVLKIARQYREHMLETFDKLLELGYKHTDKE